MARTPASAAADIKVADEVWIALALLHREHPKRADFTIREIQDRAKEEDLAGRTRPGVYQHIVQHAVANRPPRPNDHRYLFATARDRRRLYRPGDPVHADRLDGKAVPRAEDLPERYRPLVRWYQNSYSQNSAGARDPILELIGLGKEIWKDVDADEYVRQLREEWE